MFFRVIGGWPHWMREQCMCMACLAFHFGIHVNRLKRQQWRHATALYLEIWRFTHFRLLVHFPYVLAISFPSAYSCSFNRDKEHHVIILTDNYQRQNRSNVNRQGRQELLCSSNRLHKHPVKPACNTALTVQVLSVLSVLTR